MSRWFVGPPVEGRIIYECDVCEVRLLVDTAVEGDGLPEGWTYWPKVHKDLCPICTEAKRLAEGRLV